MNIKLVFAAASAALLLSTAQADAATLIVNASGQLTRATGVNVGGKLYDVTFADGTCAGLFGSCDNTSTFIFDSIPSAGAAAQALLDQVFVGVYDNDPSKILGCSSDACYANIPFLGFQNGDYAVYAAGNTDGSAPDFTDIAFPSADFDTSRYAEQNFALFSLSSAANVPEPATWAMMVGGFGMLGVAARRRARASFANA